MYRERRVDGNNNWIISVMDIFKYIVKFVNILQNFPTCMFKNSKVIYVFVAIIDRAIIQG